MAIGKIDNAEARCFGCKTPFHELIRAPPMQGITDMLNLIKPGHVLRFGICPSTLTPPAGTEGENDNTRADEWPIAKKSLGNVVCLSHPSGNLAPICSAVATSLRGGGTRQKSRRGLSYSPLGRQLRRKNVQVGAAVADFVGYTDGQTNYSESAHMVFSKDFSGCLMVVYTLNGVRYVAHAAASAVPSMDCKQAFLTKLQGINAELTGWFRPFVQAADVGQKISAYAVVKQYIGQNINKLTTFGVVVGGQAYSIDAFKPDNIPGNNWVVTNVAAKTMSQTWTV